MSAHILPLPRKISFAAVRAFNRQPTLSLVRLQVYPRCPTRTLPLQLPHRTVRLGARQYPVLALRRYAFAILMLRCWVVLGAASP